ncbi:type I secretion system permease/ATPase [Aliiruegeria sabulilitoris]|uniref:type I secretion system permease/ATPase n=1 Tax=Aliiruegeria sabulilitoris TaxID=1510458 RepID=UPI000AEB37D7|nr:ATP-binding cassette domain-containing protein [Aliiruegeria sabulilitoris]NDR57032.1 ATP-binding cassette domain-containing protein [Pseudoruegeria sp. M32A2M]
MMTKVWPLALPVVLFSILINLLRLTVPLYMLQVIDRVMSSESEETLVSISIVAFAALATSMFLSTAIALMQNNIGAWLDEKLYRNVVKNTLGPTGPTDARSAGGPVRELGQLRQFFSSPTISTVLEVPWSFVFIAILYYLHPTIGMVATVAAIILLTISIIGESSSQSRTREGQREKEMAVAALETAVQSSDAVRAMGMTDRIADKLHRQNVETSGKIAKALRGTTIVQNGTRFLRTLAQITILGTGAYLVLQNEVTMGTMIAGSILLGLALSPVDKAVGSLKALTGMKRSVEMLNNQLAVELTPADAASLPLKGGISISVRQAMFMPQGQRRPVLRPVTLEIAEGECIGIIGPVAAGKSTLCRLLAGATAPSSGSVRANDVELVRLSGEAFGQRVGYLAQAEEPLVGTIAENISRFESSSSADTEAAIAAAAKLAGISEAILALPQRFSTTIGRGGDAVLSRGQIQQILIARTFYKDPSYIVMDEPGAYLDKTAEAALIAALDAARERRSTMVLVTQRSNLLNKCDRLIYLREGSLVTVGDREKVLHELSQGNVNPGPRRIEQDPRQGQGNRNLRTS